MLINAKPMDFMQVIDFDTKDILQVYKGRLDNCRCGCAGDYYKLGEDDREIDIALNLLRKYADRGEVKFDRFKYKGTDTPNELYLEFETHVKDSRDNDLDDEDEYDYYTNEEMSMGYAFYIKDIEE